MNDNWKEWTENQSSVDQIFMKTHSHVVGKATEAKRGTISG